jgi:hypothetical protein
VNLSDTASIATILGVGITILGIFAAACVKWLGSLIKAQFQIFAASLPDFSKLQESIVSLKQSFAALEKSDRVHGDVARQAIARSELLEIRMERLEGKLDAVIDRLDVLEKK